MLFDQKGLVEEYDANKKKGRYSMLLQGHPWSCSRHPPYPWLQCISSKPWSFADVTWHGVLKSSRVSACTGGSCRWKQNQPAEFHAGFPVIQRRTLLRPVVHSGVRIPELLWSDGCNRGRSFQRIHPGGRITLCHIRSADTKGGSQFNNDGRLVITNHPVQQPGVFDRFKWCGCDGADLSLRLLYHGRACPIILYTDHPVIF